jgi:phenylalanyl-tRNA synthetase beta chain
VRNARSGEELVTLDGVKRALRPDLLVIADAERATAIAGVMGGQDSEVGAETVNLLIECAHFERKQIRATRRALGLSSDASYRFERGVDPTGMERALERVVELILAVAGGQAQRDFLDVNPLAFEERELTLRLARVEQVLGQRFTTRQVGALLEPIGFERTGSERTALSVRVPGHRWFDVAEEIDLVEEVARRHGYNAFPSDLRPGRPSAVPDDAMLQLHDRLRTRLVGAGLLEARTAGFAAEAEGDVTLMLPLSSAESRLRRALLPGLLHRAEYNFTRGVRDVRLFELGSAFAVQPGHELPAETMRLAIVLTGARAPMHWTGNPGDFQIWDLKGQAEDVAHALGLLLRPGLSTTSAAASAIDANAAFEFLHGETVVGQAGRVRGQAVDAPAWAGELFALEVVLSPEYHAPDVRYQALPVLPAIEQDLALIVPAAVNAAQVENILRSAGGDLLEDVVPFDLYEGAGLPPNTRSLAFRLRFRAPDRTLTDADARTLVGRMLKRLKDEHGIERR